MSTPDLPLICMQMAELQVRRRFYIQVTNKQMNAAKALVRRAMGWRFDDAEADRAKISKRAETLVSTAMAGKPQKGEDADIVAAVAFDLAVIAEGLKPFERARKEIELEMKKLTRHLPTADWAAEVRGLGELGLAVIIGEAGDLSRYSNPAKLWKRLGLAPYNGKAMSTWRREGGLTADDWKAAGYAPKRRAEIYSCVADPMAKHQLAGAEKSGTKFGLPKGPFGEVYVKRREATLISHPEWTPKHAQMDALRIMTKALVLGLWAEWRRPKIAVEAKVDLAAAEHRIAA